MPSVSVIVSSFNRISLLRDALASLDRVLADGRLQSSVVVFDAGSTDGSVALVESFRAKYAQGRVHLLRPSQGDDTSFAAGLNAACEFALRVQAADYLLFFETDNFARDGEPFVRAVRLLEREQAIAAAGFVVRKRDGSRAGFGEPFPTTLAFVLGQQLSGWLGLTTPRIIWMDGGAEIGRYSFCDIVYTSPLVVRGCIWRELGGMDAGAFPFSDSDLDLAFPLRHAGYRSVVLDDDSVCHDNLGRSSQWSATRALPFHAARFRLLRRYRGPAVLLCVPLLFLRHVVEFFALTISPSARAMGKPSVRVALMRSVWNGYRTG
jgi:GT2 family glycosyltransferase